MSSTRTSLVESTQHGNQEGVLSAAMHVTLILFQDHAVETAFFTDAIMLRIQNFGVQITVKDQRLMQRFRCSHGLYPAREARGGRSWQQLSSSKQDVLAVVVFVCPPGTYTNSSFNIRRDGAVEGDV